MGGNWQNSFGSGGPVRPSAPSYERVVLTEDTALVWPLESSPGTPSLSGRLDVVPGQADLTLSLPDATQGGTGIISIVVNPGGTSFVLADTYAAQVGVIGAGEAWVLSLLDNGTPAGSWNLIQLGALTSEAQAGQLAGAGLAADGDVLNVSIDTYTYTADQVLSSGHDASGIILAGAVAKTFQMDAIATVGDGWWCLVSNQSTADLTLSTSLGDTINGVAQLVLPPGGSGQPYSCLIVASSTGFNTFAGTPPIIPVAGGGTGASTAGQALINLGGGTIGIQIFEAEDAAAVLALLGIGASAFKELTVATDQNLNEASINNAYVCTASSTNINLPDSTDLDNQYVVAVYAQGGTVSINPLPADSVNGAAVGVALVMPQGSSMLLTTDANHNWWPFFYDSSGTPSPSTISWCVATGDGNAILGAFTPPITALTDGLLVNFRAVAANTATGPTFQADLTAGTVIKKYGNQPLNPSDIPGANAEVQLRYNSGGAYWELLAPMINLDLIADVQGYILYRTATLWVGLAPGSDGQKLRTQGAAANPIWDWDQPGTQVVQASAANMDLGLVAYNNVLITGVNAITDFGSSASAEQPLYFLEFDDVATLTNSGNLSCPGGANIVTAAGDTAIAQYEGGGVWKIRQYSRFATAP